MTPQRQHDNVETIAAPQSDSISTSSVIGSAKPLHVTKRNRQRVIPYLLCAFVPLLLLEPSTQTNGFQIQPVSTHLGSLTTHTHPFTRATTSNTYHPKQQRSVLFSIKEDENYIVPNTKSEDKIYRTALINTFFAILASSGFGVGIGHFMGRVASEEFFAGYLVEQSLSVDNLFVFLLLFDYFKVPLRYQNRVLNWGIFGAIVMRATMISLGSVALENFHGVLLIFAAILIYSSGTVILELFQDGDDEEEDMKDNAIVNFSKKLLPTSDDFDGDRFFTVENGVKMATPLLLCMVCVEISDVVFAVDSIPAVFGVTEDPFIVFSSNIFAILGLRSLYTILSKAASDLKYLEPAVALVLGFIGSKMVAEFAGYTVATLTTLAVVVGLLTGGVLLSILDKQLGDDKAPSALAEEKNDKY